MLRRRLMLQALERRIAPATFTVTNALDTGAGSLRAAITSANGTSAVDDIVFDAAFFSTPQSIPLATALPDITFPVNLIGTSAANVTITRAGGAPAFRILTVNITGAATVSLSNLTITGGSTSAVGGGLSVVDESLTITNCVITGNISTSASGGGGIAVASGTPTITITGSTISNNTAPLGGGIAHAGNGQLTIERSAIVNNSSSAAGTGGGGINTSGSTLTARLRNSTVSGNKSANQGGGIRVTSTANWQIRNSTIAYNTAAGSGGGIAGGPGTHSFISTIIAQNVAGTTGPDVSGGTFWDAFFSLVGNGDGGASIAGAAFKGTTANPIDPLLGPLALNGGTTLNHQPAANSPAVGAGDNPLSLATDQRGGPFDRDRGDGLFDIGAVEAATPIFVLLPGDSGPGTLRQAVAAANTEPGSNTVTIATFVTLTTGAILITTPMTIEAELEGFAEVSGGDTVRVFDTYGAPAGTEVTFRGLVIRDGKDTVGAGLGIGDEHVILEDCVLQDNSASNDGGAIYVIEGGRVTIRRSWIANNTASFGGGISFYPDGGSLLVEESLFSGNTATNSGGAIYFAGAEGSQGLSVRNSTLSGNRAGAGAAILGRHSSFASMSLDHVTITGNTSTATSGVVFGADSFVFTVSRSVIAGNTAASALFPDLQSGEVSLVDDSALGVANLAKVSGSGILIGAALQLGPLADNGGFTPSHLPAFTSPLVDALASTSATTDQRGLARPFNGKADIGAVEVRFTSATGITPAGPAVTKASSVSWIVSFAEPVTGLTPANFQLTGPGSISSVTGTGTLWKVNASASGSGILDLRLTNSAGLDQQITNVPIQAAPITIDQTAPVATAIEPIGSATISTTMLEWAVTFSEPVTGLKAANFGLAFGGSLSGTPTITGLSGSGSSYTVTANTNSPTGEGVVWLDLVNTGGGTILDVAGNPLTAVPFKGDPFVIDRMPPTPTITASHVVLTDALANIPIVIFANFGEEMDWSATPTFSFPVENPGVSLTFQAGGWASSTSYFGVFTVRDLNVDLPNIDVRVTGGKDVAGNVHGQTTQADLLDLDTRNPIVTSIQRTGSSPTNASSVSWDVTFSEPVTGVGTGNFTLFNGGLGGSQAITGVTGSGATYTVTATTGSGQGNLALYLVNSDINGNPVIDAVGNPLAGLPALGPAYVVDLVQPAVAKITPNTLTITEAEVGPAGFEIVVQFNELMNQSIAPSVTFPVEDPSPTLTSAGGQWLDAKTYRAVFAVQDLNLDLADVDVSVSGAVDAVGNAQSPLVVNDLFDIDMITVEPVVVSEVVLNGGLAQRSRVTSMRVTFSGIPDFSGSPALAIDLRRQSDDAKVQVNAVSNGPDVLVSFVGGPVEFGSLADGRYTLRVSTNAVNNLQGGDYVLVGTPANGLFRLFGDADGSGQVTSSDFLAFRLAFLSGSSTFDFDNSGEVGSADFLQFRLRFLVSI